MADVRPHFAFQQQQINVLPMAARATDVHGVFSLNPLLLSVPMIKLLEVETPLLLLLLLLLLLSLVSFPFLSLSFFPFGILPLQRLCTALLASLLPRIGR